MLKLLPGVHRFKTEVHPQKEELFEKLSTGQSPEAIFITCSDSRVVPEFFTQSDPGTLFVIRNAGNIVPPHHAMEQGPAEEATIEYAINALGVRDIVVCGHSSCGAMNGLMHKDKLDSMPSVKRWLKHADKTLELVNKDYGSLNLDEDNKLSAVVQINVLVQLENLKTYPCIASRLGEIRLHGWVYDIKSGEVFIYDQTDNEFKVPVKTADGFELSSDKTYVTKDA